MRPGMPPGWPGWEPAFAHDLVRWVGPLIWQPSLGDVSWAEPALDYEAFVDRTLPAFPHHKLRRTRLPLGERAQVLCCAAQLAHRHMAAGRLLQRAPTSQCRSLLPLGGRLCQGLQARPFFAAREEMALQLLHLAAHY